MRPRGGEKVLAAFCEVFPEAPIYTLVYDRRSAISQASSGGAETWEPWAAAGRPVRTSVLQWIPGATRHYPKLLPLMPLAYRAMKLPPARLVLCSDAALAKAMTAHSSSKLVCYCHSPMRYVWEEQISEQYRATLPRVLRGAWPALVRRLQDADRVAAKRVDLFIANSAHVSRRIEIAYQRNSMVIHPPVDVPTAPPRRAPPGSPGERFYLCVGYHTAYKRLDLAVEACQRLRRNLVVVGDGPEADRLKNFAPQSVRFLGWQSNERIAEFYSRATALLFPGEEDFGIVPVESIGHGCPVIAYGVGGAAESVVAGRSGMFFEQPRVESLIAAIEAVERIEFDPQAMHADAMKFARPRFVDAIRSALANLHQTDQDTAT